MVLPVVLLFDGWLGQKAGAQRAPLRRQLAAVAPHVLAIAAVVGLRGAVLETPGVDALNHLAAIHSGASEVLVDLDLDLAEGLDTTRIEALLDDVEARVRRAVPDTTRVRVELNSPPDAEPPQVGSAPR